MDKIFGSNGVYFRGVPLYHYMTIKEIKLINMQYKVPFSFDRICVHTLILVLLY